MLRYYYGYSQEYLASKSPDWITAELRCHIEMQSNDKMWDMTVAQLSHTPMSKEGGTAQAKSIKDIQRHVQEPVKIFDRMRERRGLVRERREKESIKEDNYEPRTLG